MSVAYCSYLYDLDYTPQSHTSRDRAHERDMELDGTESGHRSVLLANHVNPFSHRQPFYPKGHNLENIIHYLTNSKNRMQDPILRRLAFRNIGNKREVGNYLAKWRS